MIDQVANILLTKHEVYKFIVKVSINDVYVALKGKITAEGGNGAKQEIKSQSS